ncbi:hypothetical protein CBER1_07279 [Cercospora berteroae]|uniref:Uncharacterized protein n=1 Tax=Cercospora berteroae TaxID=357750 RepID=A0A2S6BTM6_9PEZI|nr:hypothetical protein CBER1_07279 [Cercospora berteroae]
MTLSLDQVLKNDKEIENDSDTESIADTDDQAAMVLTRKRSLTNEDDRPRALTKADRAIEQNMRRRHEEHIAELNESESEKEYMPEASPYFTNAQSVIPNSQGDDNPSSRHNAVTSLHEDTVPESQHSDDFDLEDEDQYFDAPVTTPQQASTAPQNDDEFALEDEDDYFGSSQASPSKKSLEQQMFGDHGAPGSPEEAQIRPRRQGRRGRPIPVSRLKQANEESSGSIAIIAIIATLRKPCQLWESGQLWFCRKMWILPSTFPESAQEGR